MGAVVEGYLVSTARHGAAALDVVDVFGPQAILLDLRMQIMDGWSFAALYRRRAEASASILLFSAVPEAGRIGGSIRGRGAPEADRPRPPLRTIASCVADC